MPGKYPISKAEFKRRVRLVYECWPPELLIRNDDVGGNAGNAGCIMQVALTTEEWDDEGMERMVRGVSGQTLALIATKHDRQQYAEALAAVEAL